MVKIQKIHIKPIKKQTATAVEKIQLIKDFGPEGDAYGGPGERQITLLGQEEIEALNNDREMGICIDRFVPNITISGSSQKLIKGQKYTLGETEILISNVSKKCHEGCRLREEEKRICLLPTTARFASILKNGLISIDDSIELINS
jgi:MOSC domain-containing protein YiiM